jgi:Protein of unknown function (DUF3253)
MNQPVVFPGNTAVREEILRLAAARGHERSICPSEVARALAGGEESAWRPLMGPVRRAAASLARDGKIEILRKGKVVPPEAMRGVIRLRAVGPAPAYAG